LTSGLAISEAGIEITPPVGGRKDSTKCRLMPGGGGQELDEPTLISPPGRGLTARAPSVRNLAELGGRRTPKAVQRGRGTVQIGRRVTASAPTPAGTLISPPRRSPMARGQRIIDLVGNRSDRESAADSGREESTVGDGKMNGGGEEVADGDGTTNGFEEEAMEGDGLREGDGVEAMEGDGTTLGVREEAGDGTKTVGGEEATETGGTRNGDGEEAMEGEGMSNVGREEATDGTTIGVREEASDSTRTVGGEEATENDGTRNGDREEATEGEGITNGGREEATEVT